MAMLRALGRVTAAVDELAAYAEDALSNRSPLEVKLDEALSKKNYGVTSTARRDIAADTFDS